MRFIKLAAVLTFVILALLTLSSCDSDDASPNKSTEATDTKIHEKEENETVTVSRKKRDCVSITDEIILGVTSDGKAYAVGGTDASGDVSVVEKWERVTGVSAGTNHMLGLCSDGSVLSAGRYGISETSSWTDIVDIHAGHELSFGLRSDGTLAVTRLTDSNFEKWESVVDVVGRGDSVYGLRSDGRVYIGNTSAPVSENVKSVHPNVYFAVFLKNDGTVELSDQEYMNKCEGISEWTDIVDVSTYYTNLVVGLRSDGTVVAVGNNKAGQCDVGEWTDIVDVAAGYSHTVGLRSDGTVVAVGSNGYGQCNVEEWRDIVSVFAGEIVTVGIKSDGSVVATGSLWNGLGNINEWNNMKLD